MIKNFKELNIKGVKLFTLNSFSDKRGIFYETFLSNTNNYEFNLNYVQENESISKLGVFRGMHFQKDEFSQSKLIRVVKGRILDFICDLRKSSVSYKKLISIKLNSENILFLPKGIAHGFLSLEEKTILNYKCDNYYNPKYESGFNIFKSNFKMNFPIDINKIIISNKDKNLPNFNKSYKFE